MTQVQLSDPSSVRIAFVQASWHKDLVDQVWNGFTDVTTEAGVAEDQLDRFAVPGAFEIPLHAKRLAESGKYDAVVAAGLVVDGGIYRHDFVATAVIDGLMRVQLDSGVPVFSVVLTPHHFHEHSEHTNYFRAHLLEKGAEGARAALATLASLEQLPAPVTH